MYTKRRVKNITNDDGSGLILALMTLMVLSVLGLSLGAITFGSYKLGDVNRDDNSAYYIAEAGANIAYEELEKGVLSVYENSDEADFFPNINIIAEEVVNKVNSNADNRYSFENQFGDEPKVEVMINEREGQNPKVYEIISTGEVSGKKRTLIKSVEVTWVDKKTGGVLPVLPLNASIIAGNSIAFTGGSIDGDIYLDSSRRESFKLGSWGDINSKNVYINYDGNKRAIYANVPSWKDISALLNKTSYLPLNPPWEKYRESLDYIQLPSYVTYKKHQKLEVSGERSYTIIENSFITDLIISGSSILNIDTKDTDVNIVLNNLKITGNAHLNIKGKGRVNLYVNNDFELTGSSSINKSGNTSQLSLYYFNNKKLSFGGGEHINGNLLIKNADIDLSGSFNISGGILSAGNVTINGGSKNSLFIVAPNEGRTVKLTNGANRGVIITDNLDMSNGSLKYEWFDTGILFPGSSSSTQPVNIEDLISSKPALE